MSADTQKKPTHAGQPREDIPIEEVYELDEAFTEARAALEETAAGITKQPVASESPSKPLVPDLSMLPPQQREPLRGGVYKPNEALALLNSHYLIGKTYQDIAIYRIEDDGSLTFTPKEQFSLAVANIGVASSDKLTSAENFWMKHPLRHQRNIVFRPGGVTESDEHNLWQGFGVAPRKTRRRILSLLRHIWKVICRSDKDKFRYLIRWLAWAVQHPDKAAGVVVVLKSRKQGTGKTTLGWVMLQIFGPRHGALVDDKERLLGRFNDWLEPVCFVLAEEILWAGDPRTADRLKSFITADTIQIERKHGGIRQILNRLHAILTTNHDHAIPAGVGDRRFFVLDVSDEHACDKAWFDRLYQDLNNGGVGEFLDFLRNVQLGDWHPREILKTSETTEQQRMSGDSIAQWSQACIEADAIIGFHGGGFCYLGSKITTRTLQEAYAGYCKQQGLRAANEGVFGKACAEMFGPRKRLPKEDESSEAKKTVDERIEELMRSPKKVLARNSGSEANRRPWGYDVPDGETWQKKLDERLGTKK
jgi:hypothetical protein